MENLLAKANQIDVRNELNLKLKSITDGKYTDLYIVGSVEHADLDMYEDLNQRIWSLIEALCDKSVYCESSCYSHFKDLTLHFSIVPVDSKLVCC